MKTEKQNDDKNTQNTDNGHFYYNYSLQHSCTLKRPVAVVVVDVVFRGIYFVCLAVVVSFVECHSC